MSVHVETVAADLERDGIVLLPNFVPADTLRSMQRAFEGALQRMRWNDFAGFEKTERYRHMVQDVLTLDQGFVDMPLNPLVKATLAEYIGAGFQLVEAKGWLSRPTHRDFHGWHGDAWYDQAAIDYVPREVKLAVYLTDVKSGHFEYVKRSHGQQAPRSVQDEEVRDIPSEDIVQAKLPAGSAILFDTSGIHRQSVPMLEPRHAVFYNYHDPQLALQREDVEYYRYHPLILNAAFLGGLSSEDQRILGFGDKTNYVPHFQRKPKHEGFQRFVRAMFEGKLWVEEQRSRVRARLRRASR